MTYQPPKLLKAFSWHEYVLFFFLLFLIITQVAIFSQFQHLPGPVYGGDIYRNRGFIQNIIEGNPVYSDAFFINELNYYPWLTHVVYAGVVTLFGLDIELFMIYFSIVFTLVYGLVIYWFGNVVFKKKIYALLLAIIASFAKVFFFTAPNAPASAIFFPLTLLFFYKAINTKKAEMRDILLSGVFLGLTGLSYGGSFAYLLLVMGIMLVFFFTNTLFQNTKKKKSASFWFILKRYLRIGIPLYLVAFILFSIFFFPLELSYGPKYNNVIEYGDRAVELYTPESVVMTELAQLVNTKSLAWFLFGFFALLGLIYCFLTFAKKASSRFFIFWFFAGMVAVLHHLVSRPLLGTWFNPSKLQHSYFLYPILVIWGLHFILQVVKSLMNRSSEHGKQIRLVILVLFLVFALFFGINKIHDYSSSQWVVYGRQSNDQLQLSYSVGDWFKNHLSNQDVVLSHDESGFMIAALSGKKLMISRRTHASYYINLNERIADAAVIMYGNNLQKSKELIKKYGVTYFYLDRYLLTAPMRTTPEYASYLDRYGVSYTSVHDRFDIGTPDAKTYDLLLIPPQNMSESFQSLLTPVQQFGINNQTLAVVFAVHS